jgi:hypothetical protein
MQIEVLNVPALSVCAQPIFGTPDMRQANAAYRLPHSWNACEAGATLA